MSWRVAVGFLVSGLLLVLLLIRVDLGQVAHQVVRVDPALLTLAIGLYFIGTLIRTLRWRLLLSPVAQVPVARLFAVQVIGFTANDLLPARLGELARAFLLARSHQVRMGATLATIVVERLLDGLTLVAFLVAGSPALAMVGVPSGIAWLAGLLFLGGAVVLWLIAQAPGWLRRLGTAIAARAPGRRTRDLLAGAGSFAGGLAVLRRGRLLAACLALSLAAWLVEATMYYLIGVAFRMPISFPAALLGLAAANLATMIPAAPGYVGTFDAPLQSLMTRLAGLSPEAALGYTLVVHAALVVPVVVVGLLLVWQEGLSLRAVTRGSLADGTTGPARERPAPRGIE